MQDVRRVYEIRINGVRHRAWLTDAQARARGVTPYSEREVKVTPPSKRVPAPTNKQRKPKNKAKGSDAS